MKTRPLTIPCHGACLALARMTAVMAGDVATAAERIGRHAKQLTIGEQLIAASPAHWSRSIEQAHTVIDAALNKGTS